MSRQKGQDFGKYWVFTINNPEEDQLPSQWDDLEYAIWQKEEGEAGTPHLQGYAIWTGRKRLTWVKKQHPSAHWEVRKGTHAQAKAYAAKAETRVAGPWEHGEESELLRGQGKRNDLAGLKRKLDEGATFKELCTGDETFPAMAKYYRFVQMYKRVTMSQRDWLTEVTVYWGEAGIGKTSRARHEAGPNAFWLSKPGGQTTWWDDYDGQEVVVIDEFYGWIARDLMCRLCDRYPLNVETKGGSTRFLAKKIIITSNLHPQYWWPRVGLGAMTRRLTPPMGRIIEMIEPWTAPEIMNMIDASLAARINEQLTLACDEVLEPESAADQQDYLQVNPLSVSQSGQGWIDWDA